MRGRFVLRIARASGAVVEGEVARERAPGLSASVTSAGTIRHTDFQAIFVSYLQLEASEPPSLPPPHSSPSRAQAGHCPPPAVPLRLPMRLSTSALVPLVQPPKPQNPKTPRGWSRYFVIRNNNLPFHCKDLILTKKKGSTEHNKLYPANISIGQGWFTLATKGDEIATALPMMLQAPYAVAK